MVTINWTMRGINFVQEYGLVNFENRLTRNGIIIYEIISKDIQSVEDNIASTERLLIKGDITYTKNNKPAQEPLKQEL